MSATTIGIFQTIIVAFYCHGLYDSNMDLSEIGIFTILIVYLQAYHKNIINVYFFHFQLSFDKSLFVLLYNRKKYFSRMIDYVYEIKKTQTNTVVFRRSISF